MGDRAPIHATAPPAEAHVLISHTYIFLFDIDIDPTLIFAKLNKIIATSDDYFSIFSLLAAFIVIVIHQHKTQLYENHLLVRFRRKEPTPN